MKSTIEKIQRIINVVRCDKGNIIVICPDSAWVNDFFYEVFVYRSDSNWVLYPQYGTATNYHGAKVFFIPKDLLQREIMSMTCSGIIVVGSQEGLDLSFLLSRLRYKTTYKPFLKFVQLEN